jgi:molybdopterin-biosynthesis enzyme MoeA-like protein
MEANSLAEVAVKPAVLTVGDELVSGDRQHNGNERWLLSQLYERGHPADIAMQLRDDAEQIGEYVRLLRSNGHFPILVAGGLGGTHDDKTREGVARALGVPLETHSECDSILSARYAYASANLSPG